MLRKMRPRVWMKYWFNRVALEDSRANYRVGAPSGTVETIGRWKETAEEE
jgi:hypothetical protein